MAVLMVGWDFMELLLVPLFLCLFYTARGYGIKRIMKKAENRKIRYYNIKPKKYGLKD